MRRWLDIPDESKLMNAGVNTRIVERGSSDRTVIVWTRFHKTETELQRGLRERDPHYDEAPGIAMYHNASLKWVEETRQREAFKQLADTLEGKGTT